MERAGPFLVNDLDGRTNNDFLPDNEDDENSVREFGGKR